MHKLSLVVTRLISCRVPETSYLCLTFVSECMVLLLTVHETVYLIATGRTPVVNRLLEATSK